MVSSTARVGEQLSCVAIERVRRNLIVGKGGLRGLGAVLANTSSSGEGSLTEVGQALQLFRASWVWLRMAVACNSSQVLKVCAAL